MFLAPGLFECHPILLLICELGKGYVFVEGKNEFQVKMISI